MRAFLVLAFTPSFHLFASLLGMTPSLLFCSIGVVIASPFSVPHLAVRARQSDQPIYNINVDHTANSGWTGGIQPILTPDILSGQPGSSGQLIQETLPEVHESFFSNTPYETTTVSGIIGSSPEEPAKSDYPTDAEIKLAFKGIGHDQSIMFSEIGASKAATDFAHMHDGKVYEDLFPVDYTKRNGRSKIWHGDFIDRICRLFAVFSIGKVYLISKFPDGPCSTRSVWYRIEFPALKANPDVENVVLVNYENFQQQETLWARASSQQFQRRHYLRAFSEDVEDTCFNMPYTSDYRSWLPSGEQMDLTPILGAAAGWARVSVVQRNCCSPSHIHKLDVSIINARGVTIGQVTDVDAPEGQEVRVYSKTPYAIRVIIQERDEDPLIFRYGEDEWNSNDHSFKHQCKFSNLREDGSRKGDCIFTY